MKKFEDFSKEDLWKLRCEVSVNSLYYSDYHNSFGLDTHSVSDFFDGWLDFLEEEMVEDGHKDAGNKFFDYFDEYDNADFLWSWFMCYEDFSWVKYNNYTVYVGGDEVNDYYLSKDEAEEIAARWERDGYDDVRVVEIPFDE